MTQKSNCAAQAISAKDLNRETASALIPGFVDAAKICAFRVGLSHDLIEPVSLVIFGDAQQSAFLLEQIVRAHPAFIDAAVLLAAVRKIYSGSGHDMLLIQSGLAASTQHKLMEQTVSAIERLASLLTEVAKDVDLSSATGISENIGRLLTIFAAYLSQMGAAAKAIEILVGSLKIWPLSIETYLDLFDLLMLSRQFFPAHHIISQALERFPNRPELLRAQFSFFHSQVMCDELLKVSKKLHRISPGNFPDEIMYRCYVPSAYLSPDEVKHYRARAFRGLRLLERQTFIPMNEFVGVWTVPSFSLAYQNANNRVFLERQASVFRDAYGFLIEGVENLYGKASKLGRMPFEKVRIAFLSEFFRAHSNSRAFEGLIKHIDKDKFHVIILHNYLSMRDSVRDRIDTYAAESYVLPKDLGSAAKMIIELGLHVLFYTDIGMSPSLYLLALTRVAPVQVSGWGIPHTSGIDTIDYYISGAIAEPRGAAKHYTETLHCVSGLPCCYLKELIPRKIHERSYFFLPDNQFIFGCFQQLHKLHPDFDNILEKLACENPDALFVFVEHNHPLLTHRVLRRWDVRAPTMVQRMRLLSEMSREDFAALCNCVDVLLDPPYYGSGISFYESIHTGTPTITLKGRYMRSRFISGGYSLMQVPDPPLAETASEYIQLCCNYANNSGRLKELKETIPFLANEYLYEDLNYVRDVEHFLLDVTR